MVLDQNIARQLKALTLVFASMATSSVQRKDLHKSNKNMYLKFGYALSRAGDSALMQHKELPKKKKASAQLYP